MILKVFVISFLAIASSFMINPFNENYLNSFLSTMHQSRFRLEDDLMGNSIPGELCNRKCFKKDQRVCYFKFALEYYQVLGGACNDCAKGNLSQCFNEQCVTADGVERGFMSVNRRLPGTPIQVCVNDIVVVDVANEMDGTATTIHWHGLRQLETPFCDGVPFITQCPIQFGTTFRYSFYARDAGTHFYHSHAGQHKTNGIYGALIVRIPELAKVNQLYDFDLPEFTTIASDWMHVPGEQYFPGLTSHLSIFESLLINGYGRFLNKTTCIFSDAPLMVYNLEYSKRYRFRLINAASNVCPLQFQIESHDFTIIASDGVSLEPFRTDTLYFISGERYDFVVKADKAIRDYWIRIRALAPCTKEIEEFAVLRYHDGPVPKDAATFELNERKPPSWLATFDFGETFNAPTPNAFPISNAVTGARTIVTDKKIVAAKPDYTFHMFIGTSQLVNEVLFAGTNTIKFMVTSAQANANNVGVFNNISLTMPHISLLSQRSQIDESMFCDVKVGNDKECIDKSSVCRCIHRLKVTLGSIVELVLIDIDDSLQHPFHLHGHKFYVMDMGMLKYKADVEKIVRDGIPISEKLNEKPAHKDTVVIPNPGYVKIKFRADNPGFWIGHCHFDWHLAIGMAFVLQVGNMSQMQKTPKHFGTCDNYQSNKM